MKELVEYIAKSIVNAPDEVVVIEENAVVIRCREAEVKLKLKQVIENRK